ncbi:hypothetical protein HanXRQr2_Chr09g0408221 [Helianthus annuus]|uniref:Uncharacterized protein n=1 Tax=Helianthus annuus TaxID=4232 RepID=A0A9K3I9K4_HELAN|nr:hypothetical protein HanXRQr2_Chr09g0408221 [Helianthus annuus]KAJ0527567.1 hypothetical protein HanHA300_Chr09g0335371 [Helianthus annuus]KAJ0536312.1 hypothetical protein HanIR_Chr09g0440121 [Helianthus annuus]KAJ0543976.1 hypothetical protein HanHA89_Chr09g0356441 [Helianthus annuus]KAJ0709032.1 hypothetical protein HanLR1_Chr09g0335731 [Helianthus annuus]
MTPEAATPVFVTLSMRMYQRLGFESDLGEGCVKQVTLSVILHLFGPFCLQLILHIPCFGLADAKIQRDFIVWLCIWPRGLRVRLLELNKFQKAANMLIQI